MAPQERSIKLCAVYWVLGNLRPGSHSSLSSIYLAVLCKTDHVKIYGYDRILEPLLQDLKTLEELGVYVPLLGESVKGTIFSVVADNLGAHSIAGFMESFSVEHYFVPQGFAQERAVIFSYILLHLALSS